MDILKTVIGIMLTMITVAILARLAGFIGSKIFVISEISKFLEKVFLGIFRKTENR